MKAYRIVGANDTFFEGTMKNAHKKAKERVRAGDDWRDVTITEVEVRTDKGAIIEMLNGWWPVTETDRVWAFTGERLGLVEVGKDE